MDKKVVPRYADAVPRLREVAPAARASQDAGTAFFTIPVIRDSMKCFPSVMDKGH